MAEASGYAALSVEQLGTELERRGLPKSGKKDELVTRLEDDDASQGGTAPEDAAAGPDIVSEPEDAGAGSDIVSDPEDAGAGPDIVSDPEDAGAGPDIVSDPEDAAAADSEAPAEEKPSRRRGSEVSAGRKRDQKRAESDRDAPRDRSGAVAVRAQAKYVRSAPRKARLVMDHIRGKQVAEARAILRHTPRAAATDIAKLLESAVANAENNFELDPGDLKVGRAFVDEGPTIKRYRPRALGRATPIHKRTSHMTITLTGKDG